MQTHRNITLATFLVIATGTLWGFYWIPVRQLEEHGLIGAWGTLAIVATATILLFPFALTGRHRLAAASPVALASVALGGFAFVLYSVAFVYGQVAVVAVLFFLTPVWSTLIGRFAMGWPITPLRIAALVLGVLGLGVMLGSDGQWPIPRGLGEWLGLASGLLWSVATTGIKSNRGAGQGETAFIFALGATIGAAILAPSLEPLPAPEGLAHLGQIVGWVVLAGGLWWGASMIALMWATARLEPARVGILLMAEVVIGAASAALIAGETLGIAEVVGGALVLVAGVCEVWPASKNRRSIRSP